MSSISDRTRLHQVTPVTPFTLTFHPSNLAARNVFLRNFKILRSDPETAPIFPDPLLD